jgi:5-formyltetrahydrofolate cyclo-ligase
MNVEQAKQEIRERVWQLLEREDAVPAGSYGKIPAFYGSEHTAIKLAELSAWQRASIVKANPDYAQLHIRIRALNDGKLLYMAVPKIAGDKPFYLLDPDHLDLPAAVVAEKSGAAKSAQNVGINGMRPIDIVVCGSVAVNRSGARIGKGAGYSDLEVALLVEARLVTDSTLIVAPVHQLQIIDDEIPETEHDFRVDLIVTPDEVVECASSRRPRGVIWEHLTPDQVEAIPILKARLKSTKPNSKSPPGG